MKHLTLKYSLVQFFFFCTYCSCCAYLAVFLEAKGLNATLVGTASGLSSLSTVILSPVLSTLVSRSRRLTMKSLITILGISNSCLFLAMAFIPLPSVALVAMYALMMSLQTTFVPFLSEMCMFYNRSGYPINFGLARGLGSIAYALAAILLGRLIDRIGAIIPAISFTLFTLFFLGALLLMPHVPKKNEQKHPEGPSSSSQLPEDPADAPSSSGHRRNFFEIVVHYRVYFFLLFGFSLPFAAASCLCTYLIHIVEGIGGTVALYGVIIFIQAASEMPGMAVTRTLTNRFKIESILAFTAICYIFRNFLVALAPSITILIIGTLFQSITFGTFLSAFTYYVADNLDEDDQLMGQSLITIMTNGFGSALGCFIGGLLQDQIGLDGMRIFAMGLTLTGVLIVFFTIFLAKKNHLIRPHN